MWNTAVGKTEQEKEDDERKRGQYGGNGIRVGDFAGFELCENVEWCGLRAQAKIAGNHDCCPEFAQRVCESQQSAGEKPGSQRGKNHVTKCLPARGTDGVGGLLVRRFEFVE